MAKGIIDFISEMGIRDTASNSISSQKALRKKLEAENKLKLKFDKDYEKLSFKEKQE